MGRIHKEKDMLMLAQIEGNPSTSIHKNQAKPFTFRAEAYPYTRLQVSGYS